jgi:hypothetical protein
MEPHGIPSGGDWAMQHIGMREVVVLVLVLVCVLVLVLVDRFKLEG